MNNITTSHTGPDGNRWFIIATIMLVACLEILDSTIVNVALPSMMPALDASQDQITWVITSYVVASAIMIPLTGFLSALLGEKRLLLTNITGFMLCSFVCGISNSLSMMVIARALQGAFGAALIPLSMAILRQSFPLHEQGKAMAIWGIGIMVAPVLGPTLGGYITSSASWRWIFYINLPICLIGFTMACYFIPKSSGKKVPIDWLGIIAMFIGIGCLQVFLDQGNSQDWFSSQLIVTLAILSVIGLVLFIIRSLRIAKPAVKLKLFKNRNLTCSTLALGLFCGAAFGIITLQPILLESLFNYSPINAGLTLAPMGLASAICMGICSVLINRINVKYILVGALLLACYASFLLFHIDPSTSQYYFLTADIFLGCSLGFFMVPLSTYALATIDTKDITEGSGLFSYGRLLGTSIGLSLLITLVSRQTQKIWNSLSGHITVYSHNLHLWLYQQHLTLNNPQAISTLQKTVAQQASLQAFIDAFYICGIVFILIIPVILCMQKVDLTENSKDPARAMAH